MIESAGRNMTAFVPKGWIVEKQATGDLNDDGKPDLAFVLHKTDKRNILSNPEGMGVDPIDTNPRILCVAFQNANGDGYSLTMQNSTLIPRWTEPTQDDNFSESGSLHIVRGALSVAMHYFSNAGGWDTGTTIFTFRYQNKRFELIGFDNDNTNRASGAETHTSANYLTGKAKIVCTGCEDEKPKTIWKSLPKRSLMSLDQVGDGMEFSVPE
jgi:hypothetical protein